MSVLTGHGVIIEWPATQLPPGRFVKVWNADTGAAMTSEVLTVTVHVSPRAVITADLDLITDQDGVPSPPGASVQLTADGSGYCHGVFTHPVVEMRIAEEA